MPNPNIKPTLVLEINEIPLKVLKKYQSLKNINEILRSSQYIKTINEDTGELSPWISWPSLHRGLKNTDHNIKNIGQDLSTIKGTPIWQEYLNRGYSVGVFHPFQSHPAPNPGTDGFFVPDLFATNESCYPKELSLYQKINLFFVKKNNLERSSSPDINELKTLIPSILFLIKKLPAKTIFNIITHLIKEIFDPSIKEYRPILQTLISWEIFKQYAFKKKSSPLPYMSFFTNHVAGVMHRYWRDIFPEEWKFDLPKFKNSNQAIMDFAMKILDQIIGDAISYQKKHPELSLSIISCMGQDAVESFCMNPIQFIWKQPENFLNLLMKDKFIEIHHGMHPQVTFVFKNPEEKNYFVEVTKSLVFSNDRPFAQIEDSINSVTISPTIPNNITNMDQPLVRCVSSDLPFSLKSYSLQNLGFKKTSIPYCTGYHIKEGIWLIKGDGAWKNLPKEIAIHSIKKYFINSIPLYK